MGQIRIISGLWRARKINISDSHNQQLRPSTDRARTVLFDWLRHLSIINPDSKIADLFCGSGILGIEAISQAGKFDWSVSVAFVDNNPSSIKQLNKNLQLLQVDKLSNETIITCLTVEKFLKKSQQQKFDLIFCDPPYQNTNYLALLSKLEKVVNEDGILYLECASTTINFEGDINNNKGWQIIRKKKVAHSSLYLLQKT